MSYHEVHALFPPRGNWQDSVDERAVAARPDSSEDHCIAAMMDAIGTRLDADALLVNWFSASAGAQILHMDEHCREDAELRLVLHEFASQLARACEGFEEPMTQELPSALGRLTALAFPSSGGVVTVTSLADRVTRSGHPGCGAELASFFPTLRPFFDLWAVGHAARARAAGLECAVENCGIAMFMVDRRCRVLFANEAGEKLAARGDGISLARGRLTASELADTMRLQAAVEHICAETGDTATLLPIVALKRARGRHLMVTAVAVPASQPLSGRGGAILYAFDPEADLSRLMEPACKFYNLSAGETRLTCRLANGGSLAEAAKSLGVREQTARSYLKQIFLKTQTNRQAELVRLMLQSAVRVANSARMRVF